MSEVAYSVFEPYLLPLVPNCPAPTVTQALRSACIDFCTDTLYFQRDIDPPISVQAGTATYEIDVETGYDLNHILVLYFGGLMLKPTSRFELQRSRLDWANIPSTPQKYVSSRTAEFTLVPMPDRDVTDAVTGRFSIVPSRASKTISSDLFDDHAEDIAAGAAAIIKVIPNEPFTDLGGARNLSMQFSAAKLKRRVQVNAGNVAAPLRVNLRGGRW